ncbi:MAG TPA: XRE family transcriptional regulator [Candidatus Acidoferrales bacterium]|nr:XRE family transcriptional regulator [Candidatus Acidoferrales bacterium]
MNSVNELIGRRLKYAREKLGLTQAQLSEGLGFKDRQTLAAIEAGQRKVTAEELVRAAQALKVDIDFFTDSLRLVGEGSFSWRAHRNADLGLLSEFEDKAGRWIATYRTLGERAEEIARPSTRWSARGKTPTAYAESPLQPRLTLSEKSSFEDAWAAAEALVREWQLGEIPALTLEEAIKTKLSTLVLYVDAPPAISGAACNLPGLNTILINRNEPEGRRYFDLAHECFHLLTWEQMTPEHTEQADGNYRGKGRHKRIEQLADNFAGAILMPWHAVFPKWESRPKGDIHSWLNRTASGLCVTAQALKWRLHYLGLISKADLLEIQDARLTANGRPGRQPKPRPFSAEFVKRLHVALSAGKLSVRRAASLLGTTIDGLADLFRAYDFPVPFDL